MLANLALFSRARLCLQHVHASMLLCAEAADQQVPVHKVSAAETQNTQHGSWICCAFSDSPRSYQVWTLLVPLVTARESLVGAPAHRGLTFIIAGYSGGGGVSVVCCV